MSSKVRSPLTEYLTHISESDGKVLANYERDHCGLSGFDPKNIKRSRYGEIVDKVQFTTPYSLPGENLKSDDLVEQAKNYPSHPNYTNAWSYLYPTRSAQFINGRMYQVYVTDPDNEQFCNLIEIVDSLDRVVLKYPRTQGLEKRYDTVVAYSDSWNQMKALANESLLFGIRNRTNMPAFSICSKQNISATVHCARTMKDASPGQYWEKTINESIKTNTLDRLLSNVQLLRYRLEGLMEGVVQ